MSDSERMREKQENITVLVVEADKKPYVKDMANELKALQREVGGWVETIYPFREPVALVCNEEGKLIGLPLNRALRDQNDEIYDIIAGTFLVVGLKYDDFTSLTAEQIQQFTEMFQTPEQFVKINGTIVAVPMPEEAQRQVQPADPMPDNSITVEDMERYGYRWNGMLPMREEAAAEIMKSYPIYCLYGDDTEEPVLDLEKLRKHAERGGIFGVEKEEWLLKNGGKTQSSHRAKISVLDRLKSAKTEPHPEKPSSQKEKKTEYER